MNAYSERDAIYFNLGDLSSFARFNGGSIESGRGHIELNLTRIDLPFELELKRNHCAEHKVYNSFMSKIKHLDVNCPISYFINYVPSLEEAKAANSFSLLCGTTLPVFAGTLLLLSSLPNLLRLGNTNILFMILWLIFAICFSVSISKFIQFKYFLAEPLESNLRLAIRALKELFNES